MDKCVHSHVSTCLVLRLADSAGGWNGDNGEWGLAWHGLAVAGLDGRRERGEGGHEGQNRLCHGEHLKWHLGRRVDEDSPWVLGGDEEVAAWCEGREGERSQRGQRGGGIRVGGGWRREGGGTVNQGGGADRIRRGKGGVYGCPVGSSVGSVQWGDLWGGLWCHVRGPIGSVGVGVVDRGGVGLGAVDNADRLAVGVGSIGSRVREGGRGVRCTLGQWRRGDRRREGRRVAMVNRWMNPMDGSFKFHLLSMKIYHRLVGAYPFSSCTQDRGLVQSVLGLKGAGSGHSLQSSLRRQTVGATTDTQVAFWASFLHTRTRAIVVEQL